MDTSEPKQKYPDAFTDGSINITESENSIPKVLSKVDYGSRLLCGMLSSDDELASHKVHSQLLSAFTTIVEGANKTIRSEMVPSTAVTYAIFHVNTELAQKWNAQPGGASHATIFLEKLATTSGGVLEESLILLILPVTIMKRVSA